MLVHSPVSIRRHPKQQGFTLIELLMVIAIILILAGITFGISRGVQNAQARAKAKAELATISQAIEQFKSRYGDYPWHDSEGTDTNQMLLFALTGRLAMEKQSDGSISVTKTLSQDDAVVMKRPKFLDESKFSTSEDTAGNTLQLLDPWGNPYVYWYKWEATPDAWDVFGYHLYSTGSKGSDANDAIKAKIPDEATGVLDDDFRDVANAEGIIFAGE